MVGVCVLIAWGAIDGGYPSTTWYPGALFLLALLAVVLAGLGPPKGLSPEVRLAIACLAGYTVWSYLSILWAAQRADAWDGANRTLLYLLIFSLFATRPVRAGAGPTILIAWILGVALIAIAIVAQLATDTQPLQMFVSDRLADPTGYPNATAALWLSALLPAALLAGRAELPGPWRGLLAAAAVVLGDAALLTQSRGGAYSVAIVAVVAIVIARDRVRLIASLAPVAVAIAVTAPALLELSSRLAVQAPAAAVHAVTLPILPAAAAVGLVVALAGAVERSGRIGPAAASLLRVTIASLSWALALGAVLAAVIVLGNPLARVRAAWRSFEHPALQSTTTGPAGPAQSVRLAAGLSGYRYDYYRVALDAFSAHPLQGIGADNFAQLYLRKGRSATAPKYPHSIELRTLAQTGLVGLVLLLLAFGPALRRALGAARHDPGLGGAVATAALLVWVYWIVQGSVDWLWEFPALGGAAMAMLGLACACGPLANASSASRRACTASPVPRRRRRALAGATSLVLLAGGVSLAAPWLSEHYVGAAEASWQSEPAKAFGLLDRAASLNPLSDRPLLVKGTIALRLGQPARALQAFEGALARSRDDAYATLELGALASARGQPQQARRLLERAHGLDPDDPVTSGALARVIAGGRVDVGAINRLLASSS